MPWLIAIALIVSGASLIVAGVGVAVCHVLAVGQLEEEEPAEAVSPAHGWGFQPQDSAMAEPYESEW